MFEKGCWSWSMWIKLQYKIPRKMCTQTTGLKCRLQFDCIWYHLILEFLVEILNVAVAVGTYPHFSGWTWTMNHNSRQTCDQQHTVPDILDFNTGLLVHHAIIASNRWWSCWVMIVGDGLGDNDAESMAMKDDYSKLLYLFVSRCL